MSELALSHGVVERFPNGVVHDGQVLRGDQCHEAGHQSATALHVMVDAGIPVFQFLGSDVRDDELRQPIKFGRKILVGHSHSLPGKSVTLGITGNPFPESRKTLICHVAHYSDSVKPLVERSSSPEPRSEMNDHSLGTLT